VVSLGRKIFTLIGFLMFAASAFSQSGTSNIGTEFWTAWMDHIAPNSNMNLYIAGDVATSVTVSSADGTTFNTTVNVVPNQITIVPIPLTLFLGNLQGTDNNKAIHVVSKSPVAVYSHIYYSAVSGATLLLPVNTLATDYYSLNYTQISNATPSYSIFMVIATEDNTTVEITPSQMLIDASAANKPFTVTLKKGEVYQGLSNFDLTGTRIRSISTTTQGCKRIAVFSGSNKIAIGSPNKSSDNLYQQVYPTQSWGKNYITVPLKNRPYDIYRIALSDTTAQVTLNGTLLKLSQFTNKFYYEFNSQSTNVITSNKPIQVIQYTPTQGNSINGTNAKNDTGDPEMIYLNPLEQTIDHVTLYSASQQVILQSYVNILIPTAAVSSFKLDGLPSVSSFTAVPSDTAYSYAQFSVSSGTHTLAASQGFNAIAYGFGNAESYGYSAGTNVKNLNEYIQYTNATTNQVAPVACSSATFDPQIILPYATIRLIWDLGKGAKPDTILNPGYTKFVRGTDTLYRYNYSKPITYSVGVYAVQVTAFNPIGTNCGSDETINLSYTVANPPVAKFTANNKASGTCIGDGVQVTDQSTADAGTKIVSWLWDFGDGIISTIQNPPVHTYSTYGNKIIKLTVTIDAGCSSTMADTIHVSPLPVAGFGVQKTPLCDTRAIRFRDSSTVAEGKIVLWQWNFGDGTTEPPRADTINVTHTFPATGTYPVTLFVTTDKGCVSTLSKQSVTINPVPTADFTIPDVCLADYYAIFKAKASIADNSALTYTWDFGDAPNSTPANPNVITSTADSIKHHYSSIGTYTATLKVTAAAGCATIPAVIKTFTVNGSSPKAAFSVTNSNNAGKDSLCSNLPVLINNTSSVPGAGNGVITKLVMHFDDGNPDSVYTGTIPSQIKYTYPVLAGVATKTYHLAMQVFSGTSIKCSDIKLLDITLLPPPVITFTGLTVCQNDAPFPLTVQVTGPTGPPGVVFSGAGVVGGKTFNPLGAGVGKHVITATYTAGNACVDVKTDTITVNPSPISSAGPNLEILAGGRTTLQATATGTNLIYKWTPATGLDHDNILTPIAAPAITTIYTLVVTNNLGCPSPPTTAKVTVFQAPTVPNTFTPNGDSRNDTWVIPNLSSYPDCTVEVFNRNGQRVFYSLGYGIPWDGRFNGENLPVGTYYYIIDPKHGRSKISGPVTIIR
jgi:gliding motility-associated-like protein